MKNVLLAALLAFVASANALAQDVAAAAKFSVWLPSKSWALELQAPGFVARANEMQADGRRYFRAENERRSHALPGETIPDARTDDSFQKLMQEKEFRQFVDSLYGGKSALEKQFWA